jgi:hypothetical protein
MLTLGVKRYTPDKKMPPALRLGANPPFQRVEETKVAYKKARMCRILREFCCDATKKQIGIPKKDNTNLFVKVMT